MKRLLFILIFSCVALLAFSQEKIVFDTIPKSNIDKPELLIEHPLILDNSSLFNKLNFIDSYNFNQPLISRDYNKILNLDKSLSPVKSFSTTSFNFRSDYFSFFGTGKVFNQAAYQLNNRLLFGGNSFGVQSVFDQPVMNPGIQNMSTKGASMFMQYKVSKNVKIETRVTISNHQSLW